MSVGAVAVERLSVVDLYESVGPVRKRFVCADYQHATGSELGAKRAQEPTLQGRIEVGEDQVAAADERERPVGHRGADVLAAPRRHVATVAGSEAVRLSVVAVVTGGIVNKGAVDPRIRQVPERSALVTAPPRPS